MYDYDLDKESRFSKDDLVNVDLIKTLFIDQITTLSPNDDLTNLG